MRPTVCHLFIDNLIPSSNQRQKSSSPVDQVSLELATLPGVSFGLLLGVYNRLDDGLEFGGI